MTTALAHRRPCLPAPPRAWCALCARAWRCGAHDRVRRHHPRRRPAASGHADPLPDAPAPEPGSFRPAQPAAPRARRRATPAIPVSRAHRAPLAAAAVGLAGRSAANYPSRRRYMPASAPKPARSSPRRWRNAIPPRWICCFPRLRSTSPMRWRVARASRIRRHCSPKCAAVLTPRSTTPSPMLRRRCRRRLSRMQHRPRQPTQRRRRWRTQPRPPRRM